MTRKQSVHWLRENAATRSPHRVLYVDTETRPITPERPGDHVLRLWDAVLVRRHGTDPGEDQAEAFRGTTTAELVELVERFATRDRTLWVVTHNLSFDLAVTALPVELADRGWRMTEGALTSDAPWMRMVRGERRITVADSWSWLPTSVEKIGELIGIQKIALPDQDESDEAWHLRCAVDVAIIAAALTSVMDWWDELELGNWSVTGPACGWSTYRHRSPRPRVLIDPDPARRAFEARAVHGGRRDVRRIGRQPTGLYVELDIATAHLIAMASCPLPSKAVRKFDQLGLDSQWLGNRWYDVIADVELETDHARYPWDSGAGMLHPVGRFRTTLAGPEIRAARERGELRRIGPGIVYAMVDHMAPWAGWLATLLDPDQSDTPPAARLTAKYWSRCVPGKWAGRTSETVERIPDPRPGWQVIHGMDAATRSPVDLLRFGGELLTIARDLWADDAFPAVLAFIQSHTRLALGALLDELGDSWITANTDGVIVDARRWWQVQIGNRVLPLPRDAVILDALAEWIATDPRPWLPFTVRVKGAWRDLTVYGPQHLELSGERRLAGIPRTAIYIGDGEWSFTAWPRLHVQLRSDRQPMYSTEQRTVKVTHIPPPGWLLADGRVIPAELETAAGRSAPLPPWSTGGPGWHPIAPADRQHRVLRELAIAYHAAATETAPA